jgi:hypothetical protein
LFARDNHFVNIYLLLVTVTIIPESDPQIIGTGIDFDRCKTPLAVLVKVVAINPRVYGQPAASSVSFQIKVVVVIKVLGHVPELNLDLRVTQD